MCQSSRLTQLPPPPFFFLVQDVHVVAEDRMTAGNTTRRIGPLMMGARGDGRGDGCRGVRGAAAGRLCGAAATLGGVHAAAACGGGRCGVHQVVLLVLVEDEEEDMAEEEEIYPNCQIFCWIHLTTIILKTWPPFHTSPPHWTASPWELWTHTWNELLQLIFFVLKNLSICTLTLFQRPDPKLFKKYGFPCDPALFFGYSATHSRLRASNSIFGEVRGLIWSTFPWSSTSIKILMER